MLRDVPIILVSPGAHYPAHNWTNTVALLRALRQQGQDVRAVIFSHGTEPVPADLADRVTRVFARLPPGWGGVTTGRWQERRFGALMNGCETLACLFKARAQSRGADGAVLHFIGGSYWLVVLAALLTRRRRFVYSLYGGLLAGPATGIKSGLRRFLTWLLRRAVGTGRLNFTCENEFLHDQIAPLVGPHIHVVPYAIDDTETLPSRTAARERLRLPPDENILLFFGTHRREKDYHTSLNGCLALARPPLALFVGKVISTNDPGKVVAECGYPNARVVDAFVPEAVATDYFAAADAVVLPYEADFSRGSGVLIEGCRHLRPMIVSATPYFSKFMDQYGCGVTYAPGDRASFAAAAQRLLASPERFQTALAQARRDHSWSAAAEKYLALYRGTSAS